MSLAAGSTPPGAERKHGRCAMWLQALLQTQQPVVDLSGLDLEEIPAEVANLPARVRTLTLSDNYLWTLPEAFGARLASTLTSLHLGRNVFHEFPAAICALTALRHLKLNDNSIEEVPAAIGELRHLEFLALQGNCLTTLPDAVARLTALRALLLSENLLTALPECIGDLQRLQTLDVSKNHLTALPASLGGLTTLVSLRASYNYLPTLPHTVGRLSSLTALYLDNNCITSLPQEIAALGSTLRHLSLSSNLLASFPVDLLSLVRLRTLYLSDNAIQTLPWDLCRMVSLQVLTLDRNLIGDALACDRGSGDGDYIKGRGGIGERTRGGETGCCDCGNSSYGPPSGDRSEGVAAVPRPFPATAPGKCQVHCPCTAAARRRARWADALIAVAGMHSLQRLDLAVNPFTAIPHETVSRLRQLEQCTLPQSCVIAATMPTSPSGVSGSATDTDTDTAAATQQRPCLRRARLSLRATSIVRCIPPLFRLCAQVVINTFDAQPSLQDGGSAPLQRRDPSPIGLLAARFASRYDRPDVSTPARWLQQAGLPDDIVERVLCGLRCCAVCACWVLEPAVTAIERSVLIVGTTDHWRARVRVRVPVCSARCLHGIWSSSSSSSSSVPDAPYHSPDACAHVDGSAVADDMEEEESDGLLRL